jgi:cyclic beta-1,2-glucan synthetase
VDALTFGFGRGRARGARAQLTSLAYRLLQGRAQPSPWDEGPIREELFSVERLEEHARGLASAQALTSRSAARDLLAGRVADNEAALLGAYRDVADAIEDGAPITPAAEWLIDNFHLVEKQIRAIRSDLPSGYYRQLPKLAGGPLVGLPQVFGVAWAFVAHTDSLFDPEILRRYLRAYQEGQPLSIGELWAVAITLRIVLVMILRTVTLPATWRWCSSRTTPSTVLPLSARRSSSQASAGAMPGSWSRSLCTSWTKKASGSSAR